MNLSLNSTTTRQTKSVHKLVGNIPGNAVLRFLAQVENVDTAHLVEYAVFLGTHFSVIIASSVSLKNELVLVLAMVAVVRVLRLLSLGNTVHPSTAKQKFSRERFAGSIVASWFVPFPSND